MADNSSLGLNDGIDLAVDRETSESWGNLLPQFSDATIYQTWAYGAVRWGSKNLSHLVLRRGGQVISAAQLRIARLPLLPAGIAYLRWGPLIQRRGTVLDPFIAREALAALRQEYCLRRGLTLQIIPQAFPSSESGQLFQEALSMEGFQVEPASSGYRTVLVELTPGLDAMRKRLDQKWRNQLNRSEKNGIDLEVSDSMDAYREFVQLYEGMMQRKQFESSVNVDEFERIQAQLPVGLRMVTFLARKDGEPIGALVCSLLGDTAIYLLGATNEKARELKASYFLQWQAMLWLKQRGATVYDLGGIDPEANPGGYHFKSGFGGNDVTQLPTYAASGGAMSRWMLRGVSWARRRRTVSKPVQPEPC